MLKEILSLYYRLKISELLCFILICMLTLYAPFMHSESPYYQRFIISTTIFSSLFLASLYRTPSSVATTSNMPQVLASALLLFALLVLAILGQTIPLPVSITAWLHSGQLDFYQTADLKWFPASIEPIRTMFALWWLLTVGAICWITARITRLPRFKVTKKARKPIYGKNDPQRTARTSRKDQGDLTSDLIKWILLLSSIIIALGAAFDWQEQINSATNRRTIGGFKADWPMKNAHQLALLLNIGAIQFLMLFNIEQERHRRNSRYKGLSRQVIEFLSKPSGFLVLAVSLISTAIIIRGIFLTKTRSGLIALQLTLLYAGYVFLTTLRSRSQFFNSFFLRHQRLKKAGRWFRPSLTWLFRYVHRIGFIFFTLVGPLLFLLFSEIHATHLATRTTIHSSIYAKISKIDLWSASIKMIQEHSIFGVGFNCWKLLVPSYASEIFAHYSFDYVHNDYLQMFAELGLIGCSWIACVIGYLVWTTGKTIFHSDFSNLTVEFLGSYLGIMMFLMFALIDFPFHSPGMSIIFAILFADYLRIHIRLQNEHGVEKKTTNKAKNPSKDEPSAKELFFRGDSFVE